MTVAIIGAGMAGLSCATALSANGVKVHLFDKGRGPGGRMATRRAEVNGKTLRFDHGAQYFTARDQRFEKVVSNWMGNGVVASWPEAGDDAFVGTPAMNAPIKALAEPLDVAWGSRVEAISRTDDRWRLECGDEIVEAGSLVIAVPAEQVAPLCTKIAPDFADWAEQTRSAPCWALMAAFDDRYELADTFRADGPVAWAARNGAKPGRDGSETWVVHASPEWSAEHLELDAPEAAELLLEAFFDATGIAPREPTHLSAHRWRYAMADPVEGRPALWSSKLRLGVAGDWLIAPRVESAWVSGRELADRMLADSSFMETA